jgi:hypothetical protein
MIATATRQMRNGAWWYRITSARRFTGRWVRANGKFTAKRI